MKKQSNNGEQQMTYKVEDFGPFTLSASSHSSPAEGMCVMEMVSFLAGEEWSDMPECSSPVVASFCQVLNDGMGQDFRDRLQFYVPRLIGTASPEHDLERAEYLAWSAIRIFAPMALDAAGLNGEAEKLRGFNGSLKDAASAAKAAYNTAFSDGAYAAASVSAPAFASAEAAYASTSADAAAAASARAAAYSGDADAEVIFDVLDGLLRIGPSGTVYTDEHLARVEPLRKATNQVPA